MKNLNIQKNNGGFTIVETLVAVTVLMIAIAGPMVAASKGLNTALYARDQMTATFLAQEVMEVIKADRSNTYAVNQDVSDWPTLAYSACVGSDKRCDVSAIDPLTNPCPIDGCNISIINGENIYSISGDNMGMKFQRYFYLNPVTNPPGSFDVHVFVKWNQGAVPYEMELISQLSDRTR